MTLTKSRRRFSSRWSASALVGFLALGACGGSGTEATEPEPVTVKKLTADDILAKARTERKAGRMSKALKRYRRALRMRPDHYETLSELVELLLKQRLSGEAVGTTKAYVDRKPGDLRGYQLYARALYDAGSFRAAEDNISQLIELDDKNATAFNFRARVRVGLKKFQEAISDARRAVELRPDIVEHHIDLGSILRRAGNLAEAAIALRGALQIDPDNPRAHRILGVVLRDNYEPKEALSHHLKAARLAPQDERNQFELGLTLFDMGDPLGAEEALGKAVQLAPKDATNWYAYGQILRAQKKWPEAITAYKNAIKIDPKHRKAQEKLGLVLYFQGKLDEAEVVLTAALREMPKNPFIYWNLATVYEKGGKLRLAIQSYQAFLKNATKGDGDIPKAKRAIRKLKRKIRRRR